MVPTPTPDRRPFKGSWERRGEPGVEGGRSGGRGRGQMTVTVSLFTDDSRADQGTFPHSSLHTVVEDLGVLSDESSMFPHEGWEAVGDWDPV